MTEDISLRGQVLLFRVHVWRIFGLRGLFVLLLLCEFEAFRIHWLSLIDLSARATITSLCRIYNRLKQRWFIRKLLKFNHRPISHPSAACCPLNRGQAETHYYSTDLTVLAELGLIREVSWNAFSSRGEGRIMQQGSGSCQNLLVFTGVASLHKEAGRSFSLHTVTNERMSE